MNHDPEFVSIKQHASEMDSNLAAWQSKPLLSQLYRDFHELLASHLPFNGAGIVVELGSGIPDIRQVIPGCIRSDLFPNPWIDLVENAYRLSFADSSISALILFDVFHHLRYPGTALEEFSRVLQPGGRVIIFEPCMSLLGRLVFGLFHHEPLGLDEPLAWQAQPGWTPANIDYYAAQGNAFRIFLRQEESLISVGLKLCGIERYTALPYILSGGYSKPQLYPGILLPMINRLSRTLDHFPALFATRLLVVLEKPA